jgi:hypothetical protein
MRTEAASRCDKILVDHQQRAEAGIARIIVAVEGKSVAAVEPICPRIATFCCQPNLNHLFVLSFGAMGRQILGSAFILTYEALPRQEGA